MPISTAIHPPERLPNEGVSLLGGPLLIAFEQNRAYLKRHFTLADYLYPFYERAGKPLPKRSRPLAPFWETDLEGSNAGRFLMGAGNTLRFCEDDTLRQMLRELVSGIASCADRNGYCMGFHREDFMILERANYTRSWLTRGLLAADACGERLAGETARAFQDWFNAYPHRRKAAELHLSYQGMIADTTLALSRVGSAADWHKSAVLYRDDTWLDALIAGDTRAIWQKHNDGAHGYELNALIAYLELYLLGGNVRYLDAAKAGWRLFRDYFLHIGGSVAICEEHDGIFPYPPASRHIYADRHTGETCNNVWWLLLNCLLSLLEPTDEYYVSEIEQTLYNVLLPAQAGSDGVRYHAYLHGVKDGAYAENTCCEGTGTMLYGMLPALVYRLDTAGHGVSVTLFADSRIDFTIGETPVSLRMRTSFPQDGAVKLSISVPKQTRFSLRIRIPGWAGEDVSLYRNGAFVARGQAGSFVTLDCDWQDGDEVSFTLPLTLRLHRYEGFSVVRGYERYALMKGPLLMAFTGEPNLDMPPEAVGWNDKEKTDARARFNRRHWALSADPRDVSSLLCDNAHPVKPYIDVLPEEPFTCFPLIARHGTSEPISATASYATGVCRLVPVETETLELAGIPAGAFTMGENGYEPCETPPHHARVERAFFLGAFPITQRQYRAVMGSNPSVHMGDALPVENVSWFDALAFIDRLNRLQGALRFRLPTEIEWEYAARAGSRDICGYATDTLRDFSRYMWNYQQLGTQSVQTNALPETHPVGEKLQNAWGLYDMLGNVGEWCQDEYRSYRADGFHEPMLRVIRGGCFNDLATYCRVSTRNALEPEWKNRFTGFRVAADEIDPIR